MTARSSSGVASPVAAAAHGSCSDRDDYHEQEIKQPKNMIRVLQERERTLELQLHEYYRIREDDGGGNGSDGARRQRRKWRVLKHSRHLLPYPVFISRLASECRVSEYLGDEFYTVRQVEMYCPYSSSPLYLRSVFPGAFSA
ncbi:hypothetical protein PIB30_062981 [Stylosanthes scabra]|uniref:Uncharacterized protein n=1 Tax=Stylosanthes scabra TaxID=79078 RepID=A0ABU6ZK01_9FABA|nr:hypothetical protein [Stylosanthes scabra]